MTNQQAIETIKKAIGYSTKEKAAENMGNAIACFAELNGWTKENAASNFVELCLEGAELYKSVPMNSYKLIEANDASNIALYIDRQAAKDISDQRG